jgi:hypothetical protein
MKLSMDGTGPKTELSGKICNGHISLVDDQHGNSSKSYYLCKGCAGMWPYGKHMRANTPHDEVVLRVEYRTKTTPFKFTKQRFIETCLDVRANTSILTHENLVERLRESVREAVGLEPGGGLDPTEAEQYSRVESQLLNIIRIVEAHSDEKFDIGAVMNQAMLEDEG